MSDIASQHLETVSYSYTMDLPSEIDLTALACGGPSREILINFSQTVLNVLKLTPRGIVFAAMPISYNIGAISSNCLSE